MATQPDSADLGGSVHLTALRADHLAQALLLSSEMGWPYRLEDWQFAFGFGNGVAAEQYGRLVATALWFPMGDAFASLGMIIVTGALQGRGLGRALTQELLRQCGSRTTFLNSTGAGQPLYERLGFVAHGTICQHQAVWRPAGSMPVVDGLRDSRPDDGDAIFRLDRAAAGMDRAALLKQLLSVGRFCVIDRGGVAAYACSRRFGRGIVIGPVVASDQETAKALIAGLAEQHAGSFVRIDVPEASGLAGWLDGIGLPKMSQATAMVRGTRPATVGAARIAALASQSLG